MEIGSLMVVGLPLNPLQFTPSLAGFRESGVQRAGPAKVAQAGVDGRGGRKLKESMDGRSGLLGLVCPTGPEPRVPSDAQHMCRTLRVTMGETKLMVSGTSGTESVQLGRYPCGLWYEW